MGSIHPSVCRVHRAIVEDHEMHHEIARRTLYETGHGTFPPTTRDRCTPAGHAPSTEAENDSPRQEAVDVRAGTASRTR